MSKTQNEINIEALTNASSGIIEFGGTDDNAIKAALILQLNAIVQGLLFVGDQIRELNQTIFDASIEVK